MLRRITLLFALSTVILSGCSYDKQKDCDPPSGANQKTLLITFPCPDSEVTALQLVMGTISDSDAKEVWVVIHPMEAAEYWVQQKATVENGRWEVMCHFGEPGQHVGKPYEFLAVVADPQEPLVSGRLNIPGWPKAKYLSQLVSKITRK